MKKVLIIVLTILFLTACSETNDKKEWKMLDLIEYTKGQIVYSTDKETKIKDTTYEDLNNYLKALQTITYNYIDDFDNSNPYYMTNNTKYIKIEYIDTYSELYDNYNVKINIYDSLEELK